jgi:hypothetical protein
MVHAVLNVLPTIGVRTREMFTTAGLTIIAQPLDLGAIERCSTPALIFS